MIAAPWLRFYSHNIVDCEEQQRITIKIRTCFFASVSCWHQQHRLGQEKKQPFGRQPPCSVFLLCLEATRVEDKTQSEVTSCRLGTEPPH